MQKTIKAIFKVPRNGYSKCSVGPRFWFQVKRTKTCWLWTGHRGRYGYGQAFFNDRMWKAHRLSWLLNYGSIPEGKDILHTCDNPPCVNPDHLFSGTHSDNMQDMIKKGRLPDRKGPKNPKAKLTEDGVLTIRKLYKGGEFTFADLAGLFNVKRETIQAVIQRRTWSHI